MERSRRQERTNRRPRTFQATPELPVLQPSSLQATGLQQATVLVSSVFFRLHHHASEEEARPEREVPVRQLQEVQGLLR